MSNQSDIDDAITLAVHSILALPQRKKAVQPPTLLNRPRTKLHFICRSFFIKLGNKGIPTETSKLAWNQVETRAKEQSTL